MTINEEKTRQFEIDEKPPNPVGIEEENQWLLNERYGREGCQWKTSWPSRSSRKKTDA